MAGRRDPARVDRRLHRPDRRWRRPDETAPDASELTLTAGTAANRCRPASHSRAVAGQRTRRCAARVAAPRPNGSSSSDWPTTTVAHGSRARSRTRAMPTSHDSWQDAESSRHVIRDLGADLRETLAADRRRALHRLCLADRARARRHAGCCQRAGERSGAPRPRGLARLEDHSAANAAGARPHRLSARCRSTPVGSTICGAASRATRSSGCWSPASARCRP